jgi:NAD(P)-dependent dehydrogenase (short-subunit alcohol dehydrogenase family)
MELRDAVAVVPGASRGIGRATAMALAQGGAQVLCVGRSTEAAPSGLPGTIGDVARQIQDLDCCALAVPCDISREEEVEALAQRTVAKLGRIDVLVNNAAVCRKAPLTETPIKRWDLAPGVSLRGTTLRTRAFSPQTLKRRNGHIINVSSYVADRPWQAVDLGAIPYFVSKIGVEGLTRTLALELQPHHLAANRLRVELASLPKERPISTLIGTGRVGRSRRSPPSLSSGLLLASLLAAATWSPSPRRAGPRSGTADRLQRVHSCCRGSTSRGEQRRILLDDHAEIQAHGTARRGP